MEQLIKRQKEDVRVALLNSGPYKLVQEFSHLQLNPEQWFSMSTTQRQAHEKKFDAALFQDEEELQEAQPRICHMSVKPEEANLTSLPLEAVQCVFRSAESLLSKENAIVQAPGSNKMAFLVESKTSKPPHYVFAEKQEESFAKIVQVGLQQIYVSMLWQLVKKHSSSASILNGSDAETSPSI